MMLLTSVSLVFCCDISVNTVVGDLRATVSGVGVECLAVNCSDFR